MRLTAVILCDAANVREGLLSVLSGGITIIARPSFPNVLGAQLAIQLLDEDSSSPDFNLEVRLRDGDQMLMSTRMAGRPAPSPLAHPEAPNSVAFVIGLPFVLPHPGRYSLETILDGGDEIELPFYAALGDDLPGATGPPPSSRPTKKATPAKKAAKKVAAARRRG
jgi:hypothetical protein